MAVKSTRWLLGRPETDAPTTKNSVLVIIDAQNEYDHGHLAVSSLQPSRGVLSDVLKKYRAAGGSIVHVVQDTPEDHKLFTPGTKLAEIFEELAPHQGEKIVHKVAASAFTGTELGPHLETLGTKKVVLAGYMAHNCILATSLNGADLGYDVSVISDAIGDRNIPGATAEQVVETVLAILGDSSAVIVKSTEL